MAWHGVSLSELSDGPVRAATVPAMTETPPTRSPGWYPDSTGATRWWDGTTWGEQAWVSPPVITPRPRSNRTATWALVLSILGCFSLPVGLILGFIALRQIDAAGVGPDGRDVEL